MTNPNDPTKFADSDRDGVDDETDAFPYDPSQQEDADGDGMVTIHGYRC